MRRNLVVSALPVSLITLLLVLVSAVGVASGSTTPAVASGTASVSGEVMGFSYEPGPAIDDPLAGVRVSVLNASSGAVLGSALTDANGQFRVSGLPAGPVKVRGTKTGWLTTFYNGKFTLATADPYTLATGQALDLGVLDIDAEAVVEGQVLGWMDPLGGAAVTVLDAVTGKSLKTVTADVSGNYRIGGLHAGSIKVRASKAGWLTGYADGASTLATATVYTLVAGQTLSQQWDPDMVLYVDLIPEAVVEGQVLSWMDPLGGATVTVLDAVTGKALKSVTADGDGYYRVGGLQAGSVKVRASKAGYITDYADGGSTFASGAVYTLMAGQTLSQQWDPDMVLYIDLAPEAVVQGQVLSWMDPLGGATVTVLDAVTGKALKSVTADVSGNYRVGGLQAGTVKVRATKAGYITDYADGGSTFASGAVYTLMAGQTLSQQWDPDLVLYIDLTPEAVAVGTVRAAGQDGAPLAGAKVVVYDAWTGKALRSVLTAADGTYRIDRLPAYAGIKVRASALGFGTQYNGGAQTLADAAPITPEPSIWAGATVVDFALSQFPAP